MAAIDLVAVMDAIASRIVSSGPATAAYAWPVEGVRPGEAVVGYPERVELDLTFQRGADRATVPVWVLCGLPQDETTRDAVSALITAAADVKDALDGTLGGACSDCVVSACVIDRVTLVGGSQHVAVRFDCDVIG